MYEDSKNASVDVQYYYNKKSAFFEELKEQPEYARISVNQFLKYLSVSYLTNEADGKLFEFNNNLDWTKITRSELFSELLDISEKSIYTVIKETDDLDRLNINKEYEIFDDCDYFFSIPSGTKLMSCDSSEMLSNSTTQVKSLSKINESNENILKTKVDKNPQQKECAPRRSSAANTEQEQKQLNRLKSTGKQHFHGPLISKKATGKNKNSDYIKNLNHKETFSLKTKNNVFVNISSQNQLNVKLKEQKSQLKLENTKKLSDKAKKEINPDNGDVNEANKKFTNNIESPQKWLETKLKGLLEAAEINKLEDVKSSIQSDSNILDWISHWIIANSPPDKRVSLSKSNNSVISCPSLDPIIAVPVLAFASVLQIHLLVDLCLNYCKANINEVLKTPTNLSCLNDIVLSRLSNMFSNVEVEAVRDKNDKIRSFLYTQLILSLSRPEPEPWKGHFSSLAKIFKCIHCKKLVLFKIATMVPCLEKNMKISTRGKILNLHERDPDWNLTEYVGNLKTELNSWRRVYWRLWAECHFLYCTSCHSHYSVYMYNKCYNHPECPKFLSHKDGSHLGYYPCCGQKAFRYECMWFPEKGCKLKKHSPLLKNNRASADIMKLFELYQPLIFSSNPDTHSSSDLKPPKSANKGNKSKKLRNKAISHNTDGWTGIPFNADKKRQGLLEETMEKARELLGIKIQNESSFDKLMEIETDSSELIGDCTSKGTAQIKFSTRFNQDNQRIYEENIMQSVNALLCRRTCCQNALSDLKNKLTVLDLSNKTKQPVVKSESNTSSDSNSQIESTSNNSLSSYSSTLSTNLRIHHSRNTSVWNSYNPLPGLYIRIESEWKDTHNIPLHLLMLPNKFPSQSMSAKLQTCTVSCSRCGDQNIKWNMAYSFSRRNPESATLHFRTEDENRIWVFDARSQELDYLSAAYIPVAIKKEYRYRTRHMKLDWDSLLGLERYWNAFLGLFFENEINPFDDDYNRVEKKFRHSNN